MPWQAAPSPIPSVQAQSCVASRLREGAPRVNHIGGPSPSQRSIAGLPRPVSSLQDGVALPVQYSTA